MAILDILCYPDERLRTKAQAVKNVDREILTLIDDMLETMYAAPGIGLAATQVNVHKQVIVLDISEDKSQPLVLINPEILSFSGEHEAEEGCLSVPGYYAKVVRPARVMIKTLGKKGNSQEFEANELLAVCIQHEMDHLRGKLFVDYISQLKRQRIKRKMEKLTKAATGT